MTDRYDARGNIIERSYFDESGKRVPTRLVVVEIPPGGQAESIGLKPGDSILSYGGREVLNTGIISRAVQVPGVESRELRISRDGKVLTFQVRPGKLGVRFEDHVIQEGKGPGN